MSYLAQFYQNKPVNLYASLIHANALPNPPFAPLGGTYAFGFDDNCNQSSLISDLRNPERDVDHSRSVLVRARG